MNNGVFENKFVYTKFEPSLVGKKVFWADTIDKLIERVKWNNYHYCCKLSGKSNNPDKPFNIVIFDKKLVYFDPNYEEKHTKWITELRNKIDFTMRK
jgi:hypothetical protein